MIKGNKKYLFFALGAAFVFASVKPVNAAQVKGTWELKDGTWRYYDASHNMYKGWVETKDGWYYLDKNTGAMLTKWQNIDGSLYYFETKGDGIEGKMHTGWYKSPEGNWYFFNNDATSNKVGIVRQGWQWIDGYCYYFETGKKDAGKMYSNGTTPDGYKLNADGRWVDDNGVAKYEAGRGYNTKATITAKKNVATRPSGGGNGGGGSWSHGAYTPEEKTNTLADGVWYGTGAKDMYGLTRGTEVVKLTVEGGKIKSAENVIYRNDPEYTRGEKILKHIAGLTDVDQIIKNVDKSLVRYDGISGATETAKGQLSAAKNAVDRSRKFANDKKEQNIEYMQFKTRPNSNVSAGNLDLTATVITVKEKGKNAVDVPFSEFHKYGIVAVPANGTPLSETGKEHIVHFKNEDNLLDIYTKVFVKKEAVVRQPSKIVVTYADDTTKDIDINNDDFRYKLKAEKGVKSVAIYDKDIKLSDGVYDVNRNEWILSLRKVELGAGYTSWRFDDYVLTIDAGEDTSNIASFELDTKFVKTSYNVGERFDMDKMIISYVTEKGSRKKYDDWSAAVKANFTASMDGETIEKGYEFKVEKAGEKTITVSKQVGDKTISQTFKIKVIDTNDRTPVEAKIFSNGEEIGRVDISKIDTDNGAATKFLELEEKYKALKPKFEIKVYNSANVEIKSSIKANRGLIISVLVPRHDDDDEPFKLTLGFTKWKANTTPVTPPKTEEPSVPTPQPPQPPVVEEPTEKTVSAEEEVFEEDATDSEDYKYAAKVTVKVNTKTKEIISVTDNATNPAVEGDDRTTKKNKKSWDKLTADFWNKFKGKTKENVDTVDTVSGATRSGVAIKKAVKKALEEAFKNN
jgi:hypothetical protein